MLIQSCPLIAFGETTPELSSQSQNKIQPQNSSGVETSTPECSGVRGSTARPWQILICTFREVFYKLDTRCRALFICYKLHMYVIGWAEAAKSPHIVGFLSWVSKNGPSISRPKRISCLRRLLSMRFTTSISSSKLTAATAKVNCLLIVMSLEDFCNNIADVFILFIFL